MSGMDKRTNQSAPRQAVATERHVPQLMDELVEEPIGLPESLRHIG